MAEKIVITGGSGFIGTQLTTALLRRGYEVYIVDRKPPNSQLSTVVDFRCLELGNKPFPADILNNCVGIINLSGTPIFTRWNQNKKEVLETSRVGVNHQLVKTLHSIRQKPRVLISASATGFYGNRGDDTLTEDVHPGNDYLATLCARWEKEARVAEDYGVRSVQVRTGMVLGDNRFFRLQQQLFKFGLGGMVGSGEQWLPWIHVLDVVNVYLHALETENLYGPVNAVSPNHVTQRDYVETLARMVGATAKRSYPAWLVRLVAGEVAEYITYSQKVVPARLHELDFTFEFEDIEEALAKVVRHSEST